MSTLFALTGDPELDATVPQRPRPLPEIAWIPLSSTRLLAAGSLDAVLLPSRLGDTSLIELLRVLDGNQTLQTLAGGTDASSIERKRLLRLLHRAGLLEEGSVPAEAGSPFLALAMDQTRLHRDRAQAQHHATRRIRVTGADADLLVALQHAGVNIETAADEPGALLQLLLLDPSGEPLVGAALDTDLPLLPVRFHGDCVDIGPWLSADRGITLAGLRRHIACEDSNTPSQSSSCLLLRALCAHSVMLLVTASAPAVMASTIDRIRMQSNGPSVSRVPVSMLADTLDDATSSLNDRLRARAESAMPALRHVGSKPHESHHSPRNLLAALELQEAAVNPRRALPGLGNNAAGRILAVLALTFGYTKTPSGIKRRSPSGGNLGSPEVLLWTIHAHRISVFRYLPLAESIECVLDTVQEPESVPHCRVGVVCIGNREKMARKYARFGETLLHLDGGVAKAFFQAAATAQSIELSALSDASQLPPVVRGLVAARSHHYVPLWATLLHPDRAWRTHLPDRRLAAKLYCASLARRRSVRSFNGPGVDVQVFARLVASTRPALPAINNGLASDVTPILRVRRADQTSPQLLRVFGNGRTEALSSAPLDVALFLQRSLDDAPYALFLTVDLTPLVARSSAEPLDVLLQYCGDWMGRLWLALDARGLGGCPCGAAIETELQQLLPLELASHSLMAAFVAGRPAT